MKIATLTNKELKKINGGNRGKYSESFNLGKKFGDYIAGGINFILTIRGLKK